jgi:predicted PolB exonuclease-like 3'-5' exonuclease
MQIVLDSETLPSTDERVRAKLAAKISAPKSMSKPDTIAKWEAEEKPLLVDEAMRKTSLDGTYGSICVIAWAIDDGPVASIDTRDEWSERDMLAQFMSVINGTCTSHARPMFIGHNIAFDLRFLWQRCVVHRVKPSPWIPFNAKPWDSNVGDTMNIWNSDRERRISLDNLCNVLGVPTSKGELDGSKVADAWAAGQYQEVADYCRADIIATRECYRRMTFAG